MFHRKQSSVTGWSELEARTTFQGQPVTTLYMNESGLNSHFVGMLGSLSAKQREVQVQNSGNVSVGLPGAVSVGGKTGRTSGGQFQWNLEDPTARALLLRVYLQSEKLLLVTPPTASDLGRWIVTEGDCLLFTPDGKLFAEGMATSESTEVAAEANALMGKHEDTFNALLDVQQTQNIAHEKLGGARQYYLVVLRGEPGFSAAVVDKDHFNLNPVSSYFAGIWGMFGTIEAVIAGVPSITVVHAWLVKPRQPPEPV
jgi:hypothetical protein